MVTSRKTVPLAPADPPLLDGLPKEMVDYFKAPQAVCLLSFPTPNILARSTDRNLC